MMAAFLTANGQMRAFQHIRQRTLADFDAEQITQHAFQSRKRNRLKGIQIKCQDMQPGAER